MAGLAAALLFATATPPAPAQEPAWKPTRPIRLVVPFAPGGQPDLVARALAVPLAKELGEAVVVENRPGAGGNIGAQSVAVSPPDGHTLLLGTNGPLAISPALDRGLAYDVEQDFTFVTVVGSSIQLLVVPAATREATLAEVIASARRDTGKLNYASVGKGSLSQLTSQIIFAEAGVLAEHIPFQAGPAAVGSLLAGDVQFLSLNPTALLPHLKAGRLRVVAQTGDRRSARIPEVPTVAEVLLPGFNELVWMVIVAPAKTPPAAIRSLNAAFVKAIAAPDVRERIWDSQWIDPVGSSPEAARRFVLDERRKWLRRGENRKLRLEE